MMRLTVLVTYGLINFLLLITSSYAEITAAFPDQHTVVGGGDSLLIMAESTENIVLSADGQSICLQNQAVWGRIVFKPQTVPVSFNEGLPSWNGTVVSVGSGFRVLIRFPYQSGWSPWLDAGYWQDNVWPGAKKTAYDGGNIDIDVAELDYYTSQWQFAVEMKRPSSNMASPTLSRLSFFSSDERTTRNINYTAVLADKPAPLFIPTTFLAQDQLSEEYGGRICSPTSVSMILRSYGIKVDALAFAMDTLDPYWDIFGVWPRVVQNACEYGLLGSVTRYRSWGPARAVLARGGRIAMSIGAPLYSGHLVMLAGFTQNGDPIVHDPARTNDGYGHVFNKSDLSHAWFDKGGVAYTFYPQDGTINSVHLTGQQEPTAIHLHQNYPNPFNTATTFQYELNQSGWVELFICDLLGRRMITLVDQIKPQGNHLVHWNGQDSHGHDLATGAYVYQIRFDKRETKTGRLLLVK